MRAKLGKALRVIAGLIVVSIVAAWIVARRSLPEYSGTVTIAGVSAPIEIVRDRDAIPHIIATTRRDALFGLGYVHAQDRLWQMEFQRRVGYGRLSEVFGRATIPQDRFLRTVGFGRVARSAWEHLDADTKADVNTYAAGVNAFIDAHRGTRLAPELTLLQIDPEPWSGPDIIVWQKMMAWDLSKNFSFELLREDLIAAVGETRAAELMPPYDGSLSILSAADMPWMTGTPATAAGRASGGAVSQGSSVAAFRSALEGGNPSVAALLLDPIRSDAMGSNNWVVDGTRTASGAPMLANDPHLDAHIPSTWYLAHLSAGEFDVIGGTLPGTPAVAIGHNRWIAWGETNMGVDVQDLYRERLDASGRSAEFEGRQEPMTFIHESIAVRGSTPIELDVRITRHGPLVSDAINANNAEREKGPKPPPLPPLAFRWTALDPEDSTIAAFLKLNQAHDWAGFTSALREYIVPAQNFVYADTAGHVGYYAPGHMPVRAAGDGARTAPGWSGEAEWNGWVPFDRLPHAFDPPEHVIVTANHKPIPAEYPEPVAGEWYEPYRAGRILARLTQSPKLSAEDMASIQADTVSLHAKSVLPLLLARAQPATDEDRRALDMLRQWDGDTRGDSGPASLFEAWYIRLVPALVEDDLGPLVTTDYAKSERLSYSSRFVSRVMARSDSPWCDDRRTSPVETCDQVATTTLHEAVRELHSRLGGDLDSWRWDRLHTARFPHQGLDAISILRPLLSRSMPNSGDWSTVDVGGVDPEHPYEQHAVPGYRQIVDLSGAISGRFLDSVGESGHPLSPHYDDFMADWRAVRYRAMRTERADIEREAIGHLTLRPK